MSLSCKTRRFAGAGVVLLAAGLTCLPGCGSWRTDGGEAARVQEPAPLPPGSPNVAEYEDRSLGEGDVRGAWGRWDNVSDLKKFRDRVIQLAMSEVFSRKALDLGLDRADLEFQKRMSTFRRQN